MAKAKKKKPGVVAKKSVAKKTLSAKSAAKKPALKKTTAKSKSTVLKNKSTVAKTKAKTKAKGPVAKTAAKAKKSVASSVKAVTAKSGSKSVAKKSAKPSLKKESFKPSVKVLTIPLEDFVTPLDDRLIVQVEEKERRTAGGLYIPDSVSTQEAFLRGKVLAVGRGHRDNKGRIKTMDVKKGDVVLFSQFSGSKMDLQNTEFTILRESDVMGVAN
ncbi:MAG: co-chaperone GroES [Pseudobdellovibrionaceae bacterium]